MVYPDSILLYHAFLVEGFDLLLLEALEVLLVHFAQFHGHWNLLFFEIIDKIRDQRAHLLLLVQHGHNKVSELGAVLVDGLRSLVDDCFEEFSDGRLMERWLKTCHGVESDAHCPDIASLIVAFVLDDLRRQAQWRTDYLLRLDVAMVVEDT